MEELVAGLLIIVPIFPAYWGTPSATNPVTLVSGLVKNTTFLVLHHGSSARVFVEEGLPHWRQSIYKH